MPDSTSEALYAIADELRGLANLGLRFAENDYDRERYDRLLALAARLVATVERRPADDVLEIFRGHIARITPSVGVEAAVMRNDELLLIRRSDDHRWALPGGLVDIGETLAEAARRELREETTLRGEATGLLGVWDSRRSRNRTRTHFHTAVVAVSVERGEPAASAETLDVGFFAQADLPAQLSPGHHIRVPQVFRLLRGQERPPFIDL